MALYVEGMLTNYLFTVYTQQHITRIIYRGITTENQTYGFANRQTKFVLMFMGTHIQFECLHLHQQQSTSTIYNNHHPLLNEMKPEDQSQLNRLSG